MDVHLKVKYISSYSVFSNAAVCTTVQSMSAADFQCGSKENNSTIHHNLILDDSLRVIGQKASIMIPSNCWDWKANCRALKYDITVIVKC